MPISHVAAWRERVGISQTKLGELLGISRDHVSKMEQGHREFTWTMQLAIERLSITLAAQHGLHYAMPQALEDGITLGLMFQEHEKKNNPPVVIGTPKPKAKKT